MTSMLVSDGNQHLLGYINRLGKSCDNYTWEVWFRPDELDQEFVIMGLRGDSASSVRLGCIPNPSKTGLNFYVQLGNERHLFKDISLTKKGEWYHVALVHEELPTKGEFILYVFGHKGLIWDTKQHKMPGNLYVDFGGVLTQTWTGDQIDLCMKGAIDEVRIWQEALSEDQIQAGISNRISNDQASKWNNRLLAYINFDSLAPNGGYTDETGNGNEFFRDQKTTTDNTTNITRQDTFDTNVMVGDPKHALDFPGDTDKYISVPASRNLQDFDELTVETWIKPDKNLTAGTYTILHQENAFWLAVHVEKDVFDDTVVKLKGFVKTKNGGGDLEGSSDIKLGEWQHVAIASQAVHKEDPVTKKDIIVGIRNFLLLNGIFSSDKTEKIKAIRDSLNPNSHDLTIGVKQEYNNQRERKEPFKGLISEVRIWRKCLGSFPEYKNSVLEDDRYRLKELPYNQPQPAAPKGTPLSLDEALEQLSCQSEDLVAYYKFDHGEPGQDNLNVNWLRDHSRHRHHGRLEGFLKKDGTLNWLPNWVEANIDNFKILTTYGNSNVVPEPGLLLQAPKLYHAETHPQQAKQQTAKNFGAKWEEIAGLYLLVNVKPNDVLVITLNGRRLRNMIDNAGVALGVAIEGDVERRSGIYYERGMSTASEERGGMSIQYVYKVPEDLQGLLAVRGMFAAYGGGTAVIEQEGKSTLDVMAYSQRQNPNA